ncbi:hypothetical protein R1sor_023364 [Riccia sorocarpa]|uniref:Uncharacterized protein n=1 Tax=Riccia sorocarpa TaxID=122646 RepID=A0ABD3GN82_9MARC
MAERSGSNDDHDAIQSVLHAIPSTSPTESVDVCSLPTVAQAIDVPTGSPQADSTPAVPKPASRIATEERHHAILSNLSPPTTRARAVEKRSNNPSLESVKEIQVRGADQSEPRRSLWPREMASISGTKDNGAREGGAFSDIIHTYTMKFENNKPTPKIPLCRLVQFSRVRQFQTTSLQTEALKKSFETHCYMEHGAAFHVSTFDENDNEMHVTDEDRAGWDMLWRMESEEFDAECNRVPEYKHLVGRKFSTWDGNHRLITWMQVSMSPERTTRKAWHPRVRCVILIPPITVYKQIEVAMHNLNVSPHATVQYDWIQEVERCLQVLCTPLSEYKEMIGADVYEEFEKARLKSPTKNAWYHENMTSTAAAYILSFGEVSATKDAQLVVEDEAKRQGKLLTTKQKKDMWEARVKDVCGSWSSQVFKYATIVNPQLEPDFLKTVRELQNTLAMVEKSKRIVAQTVGLDRVKAFASAGIHNSLKVELLMVHYADKKTREKYHHPTKFDVDIDLHPWLAQWALWSLLELLSFDIIRKFFSYRCQNTEEDVDEKEARLEEEVVRFRMYFVDTRDKFWSDLWYPVEDRQDVQMNIRRAKCMVFRYFVWHLQSGKASTCFLLWRVQENNFSMYSFEDTLYRPLDSLTDWELENCPWWLEQFQARDHQDRLHPPTVSFLATS